MPLSSPLLDDYNRTGVVTPALDRAMELTRQKLAQTAQLTAGNSGQPAATLPAQPTQPAPAPTIAPPGPSVPALTHSTAAPATVTQPTPHQQELARLTAPPLPSDDRFAHTKADTGQSGIGQIHNPWARHGLQILDAIGSAFVPALSMALPGTELHHRLLVNQAAGNVARDEKQLQDQAQREHLAAETTETEARGNEENARAENYLHPNPKQEEAGKTIETDQGIMQWNPATQRYDIPVGHAPGKEQQNVHVLPDGSVVAVHHDPKTGKSSAEVLYKGDPKETPGHVIQREVGGKLHNILVDPSTGQDRRDLGETRQPNAGSDHGVTLVGADGKVYRVEPGQKVPEGARTAAGVNSDNTPTAQTRTMTEAAPKVIGFVDRINQLIDQQEKSLGPSSSRFHEFIAGKVGVSDPEYTKLRTDIALLQTALMRMHVGARGGEQMMEHFRNLIDASKQDPDNLRAALGEIKEYANSIAAHGKAGGGEGGGGNGHAGQIQVQIPGHEPGWIPAGAKEQFLKDNPNGKVL